ncbi:MAG: YbaK/EbsC family protein [Actinobacteria bacterium]|nr:YbaK/EbsC family protein [Actinomycetota bacterium]MBV8598947.1 YbaK/EbsC family protein [Actinomycetota bacterium]
MTPLSQLWPEPVQRVSAYLRAAAVDATVQEFPGGTPTARAAAEAIGCEPELIVKSLLFVCDGAFVLALVPGDRRADERKVAAAAGAHTVRIATADEVVHATGFEPGAVAPFPHRAVARTFVDRLLLQHARVWIGAGTDTHMAALAPSDLQRLAGARTADLVTHS